MGMEFPLRLRTDLLNPSLQGLKTGCYCVVELLPLLSFSSDFDASPDPLVGFTKVESTAGNVAVSGGVVSINGNGSDSQNGIYRNSTMSKIGGYSEIKLRGVGAVAITEYIGVVNAAGLAVGVVRMCDLNRNATTYLNPSGTGSITLGRFYVELVNNTYYTFRFYPLTSSVSTGRAKITIQGGAFSSETLVCDGYGSVALSATWRFQVNRRTNDSGVLTMVKEYREYDGGYSTTRPPVVYIADAGGGSTWENMRFSQLAFPAGFTPSANMRIRYAFHDDATFTTRTLSEEKTYAQLIAEPDIIARHRFAEFQLIQDSDGNTPCDVTGLIGIATDSGGGAGGGGGISKSRIIGGF